MERKLNRDLHDIETDEEQRITRVMARMGLWLNQNELMMDMRFDFLMVQVMLLMKPKMQTKTTWMQM